MYENSLNAHHSLLKIFFCFELYLCVIVSRGLVLEGMGL